MKKYLLLFLTVLISISTACNNENDNPSLADKSSDGIFEESQNIANLPTLLIGDYFRGSATKEDNIESIMEFDFPDSNTYFYDQELIDTTISGTYFGIAFDNAIYQNSLLYDSGESTIDYYYNDSGTVGFDRKNGKPCYIAPEYSTKSENDKYLSEEELLKIAERLILENTLYDINWNDYHLAISQDKINEHYFVFRKYVDEITVSTYIITLHKNNGQLKFFRDILQRDIPEMPDYSLEEYLESAKFKIEDYYSSNNFDFVNAVTDFKIHSASYMYYNGTQHAIKLIVSYTVVYSDGETVPKSNYFFHFFN